MNNAETQGIVAMNRRKPFGPDLVECKIRQDTEETLEADQEPLRKNIES